MQEEEQKQSAASGTETPPQNTSENNSNADRTPEQGMIKDSLSQASLSQIASQEHLDYFGDGTTTDSGRLAAGSPHVPNKNRKGNPAAAAAGGGGGQRTPVQSLESGFTGSQATFGAFDESYVVSGPTKFKQPKRVSNYILGPILGEGAFGVVRDAIDVSRGQRVAIKVIRKKFRKESELKRIHKHLVNEVEYLQRFHHPGIIRAIDIFCSPQGKDYIVLPAAVASLQQLIEIREKAIVNAIRDASSAPPSGQFDDTHGGGSRVNSYVLPSSTSQRNMSVGSFDTTWDCFSFGTHTEGPLFPVTFIRDILSSLLSGVSYMHQQGVAHCDINPNNILLFRDGTVRLTDLGSCGPLFQGNGTPAFASPEIAAGELPAAQINARAYDVWCCGVVLYFLLTHRMPTSMVGISTECQLYEAIAKKTIDFTVISDNASTSSAFNNPTATTGTQQQQQREGSATPLTPHSPDDLNNARKLVERMLSKDPSRRISASDALADSWLQHAHTGKAREASVGGNGGNIDDEITNFNTSGSGSKKKKPDASTPLTGAKQGGRTLAQLPAKIRRIYNVKDIAHVINKDNVRHYHFVDDIATLMGIKVPDNKRCLPKRVTASHVANVSFGSSADVISSSPPSGRLQQPASPSGSPLASAIASLPPQPPVDPDYYVRKGKPMFDIRTYNGDPKKREVIGSYCKKVLSGYVLVGTAEENLGVNLYPEALPGDGDAGKQVSCPCVIS